MQASTKIDIAALLISSCAFALAFYQAHESERANQIAVLPMLDVIFIGTATDDAPVGFRIDNAGKGPAVVEDFKLYVDGVEVEGESNELWWSALSSVGMAPERINDFLYAYLPYGVSLREGREIFLMESKHQGDGKYGDLRKGEWQMLTRIAVRIDYRGLFGNSCFVKFSPATLANPYERSFCMDD